MSVLLSDYITQQRLGLKQLVTEYTRITVQYKSKIDLALVLKEFRVLSARNAFDHSIVPDMRHKKLSEQYVFRQGRVNVQALLNMFQQEEFQ